MNRIYGKQWAAMLGAGALATVFALPQARGSLVYEDEETPTTQVSAQAPTVIQNNLLQNQTTEQTSVTASEALSDMEVVRRERVRSERRNEDALTMRLEALRMQEEERRAKKIIAALQNEGTESTVQVIEAQPALQTQVISVPVTEGQTVATVAVSESEEDQPMQISVQPRGGMGGMMASGYDVNPRFSLGVGLSASAGDNITIEAGYSYNVFGVALNSSNPWVASFQAYTGSYLKSFETVAMKQNVADLGVKLHLLGRSSKIRPFISGGGGYSVAYVNYDQKILSYLNQAGLGGMGSDYEIQQFLGYLGGGLDVQVSKSVSIGALFKYYTVLSARENSRLNNLALYNGGLGGGYPYYGGGYGGYPQYQSNPYSGYNQYQSGLSDQDKQMVGGSLANTSFYVIQAGVTFTF